MSDDRERRRSRSRKRSRTRSRDRTWSRSPSSRRHHHHHKKRKHHRRRSRSGSVIHVNPSALYAPGPSYNHVEQELRQELYLAQARSNALEGDNNNLRTQYAIMKHELDQCKANSCEQKLRDCQARSVNIERTNNELRAQVNGKVVDIENLKKRLSFHELEQQAHKERVGELEKRNETVVKKCEELNARCRTLQMERDESIHNICVVKQQLDDAKKAVELSKVDMDNVQKQLKEQREQEKKFIEEKEELEKKIKEKERLLMNDRRSFSQEHAKSQEMIEKLSQKLQAECQKVAIDDQLNVIMTTLLGVQEQQDEQIANLKKRLAELERAP